MKHTVLDTTHQKLIWGGHDPNPNHVNESLLSEVDWGAHDSSIFLFLVNIDYDAKPNESPIQGIWGELQRRTSSIPLIGLQTDSLVTGQTGDDIFSSIPFNPDVDDPEQLTGESIQSFLTLVMHHLDLKTNIYGYVHIFQDNTSFRFPSSTHTHTHKLYISLHIIMHVSTRTCYIHHKRGVAEV